MEQLLISPESALARLTSMRRRVFANILPSVTKITALRAGGHGAFKWPQIGLNRRILRRSTLRCGIPRRESASEGPECPENSAPS